MKTWVIDAFADKPFTGNPAAVCVLDSKRADDWMLQHAAALCESGWQTIERSSPARR